MRSLAFPRLIGYQNDPYQAIKAAGVGFLHIAHFGTFDVLNYGDLLFPAVAQHYLDRFTNSANTYTYVSPVGGPPVCGDAPTTLGTLDIPWGNWHFDAAIIGGGNIITTLPTTLPAYRERPGLGVIAYPSLWLWASLKAATDGAAIAWNAPGIMQKNWRSSHAAILDACMSHSDYASVRELDFLHHEGIESKKVQLVPDTVITLSRIWKRQGDLALVFGDLAKRLGLVSPYFVLHLKSRNFSTDESRRAAATSVTAFSNAAGLTPVLLPIGRCHGDEEFLRLVASDIDIPTILVEEVLSLKETTALIANAMYALTASLHCAIVAASYDIPVNLLETANLPKYRVFFERHLGVGNVVMSNIDSSFHYDRSALITVDRHAIRNAVERAGDSVEQHFAAIADAVTTASVDRSSRGRNLLAKADQLARSDPKLRGVIGFEGTPWSFCKSNAVVR